MLHGDRRVDWSVDSLPWHHQCIKILDVLVLFSHKVCDIDDSVEVVPIHKGVNLLEAKLNSTASSDRFTRGVVVRVPLHSNEALPILGLEVRRDSV